MDNVMLDYPLVSISYCVKCKWMLRAAWYLQEVLQTFASAQDSVTSEKLGAPKCTVNSVLLKPSLVPGTFTIAVKVKKGTNWTVVWDRKMDGGFPDSKILKQKIRDVVRPDLALNHLDTAAGNSRGTLMAASTMSPSASTMSPSASGTGSPLRTGTTSETSSMVPPPAAHKAASPTTETGAPLGHTKTFAEECLDCTRTWEG